MSVVRVVPPFEVFPDVDGDPLDNGSIYVGQSGLNPEVPGNQLPVFWDVGLTIPTTQPIRTLDGFPSRNGTPSNFYVDAVSYSISVRNKNGSLVYSNLFFNIGNVEFDSPILCKTVADMKATNMLLVNGKTITAAEAATIANTGAIIETVWNNTTSKSGGAKYELKTLAQHRTDIGNPSWVPDGYGDHYLFGGTTYVAVLVFKGTVFADQFGAFPGASQTDNIQAMLNYVTSKGGGDAVMPGPNPTPYEFTNLIVKSNTKFRSLGATLKLADNTLNNSGTTYTIIQNRTYTNVQYIDLIVDGNRTNNTLFAGSCDVIEATGNASVIRCKISEAPDSGIFCSGVERSYCVDNIVNGANDVCIYTNDSLGEGVDTFEFIVSGNICINGTFGGIALKRHISRSICVNNVVYDCGNGITVEDFGGGANPNRVLISNNYLHTIGINQPSAAKSGIVINASDSVHCSDNFLYNVGRNGIALSGAKNCTVVNNLIAQAAVDGTTYSAIVATPRTSTQPILANNINGNKIVTSQGRGIYLQNAGGFVGNINNTVKNNSVESVGDALRIDNTFLESYVDGNLLDSSTANDLNFAFSGIDTKCYIGGNTYINNTAAGNIGVRAGAWNSYIGKIRVTQANADPTGVGLGAWNRGDICWNDTPAAAGTPGWVCVTAGSPGTWKAMAVLAA